MSVGAFAVSVWGQPYSPASSIVVFGADAGAASAISNVGAEVVAASGISSGWERRLGTVANNGLGGSAVILTGGAVSSTGNVISTSGSGEAGALRVTGTAHAFYTIALPARITVTDHRLNTIAVGAFLDGESGSGTLDGSGKAIFTLEARFAIKALQATGIYSAAFLITVEYQ